MGLGPNSDSFVSLMHNRGIIPENKFSLCFAKNGGYFSIGSVNKTFHKDKIRYISYDDSKDLYSIKLNDIKINSRDTDIQNEYFTVIDSGTTVSYFPRNLFYRIKQQIDEYCIQKNKCLGDYYDSDLGVCFRLKININYIQFTESMPKINFIFENQTVYDWNPNSYLFNNTDEREVLQSYCLGFLKWDNNEILLGSTWMQNHDIIFDKENKTIGLVSSNCELEYDFNEENRPGIKSKIEDHSFINTCVKDIKLVRTIFFIIMIVLFFLMIVLIFIIRELRKYSRFLWITPDEIYEDAITSMRVRNGRIIVN